MQRVHVRARRGAVRARAAEQNSGWIVVVAMALTLLIGLLGAARAQSVPEVVRPRSDAPALPGSGSGSALRSENPLADSGSVRPVPDTGLMAKPDGGSAVIKPPVVGTMPIIPPPSASGMMPVLPPPGSAGGERGVQPK